MMLQPPHASIRICGWGESVGCTEGPVYANMSPGLLTGITWGDMLDDERYERILIGKEMHGFCLVLMQKTLNIREHKKEIPSPAVSNLSICSTNV